MKCACVVLVFLTLHLLFTKMMQKVQNLHLVKPPRLLTKAVEEVQRFVHGCKSAGKYCLSAFLKSWLY